jgi:hypothetical protein
MAEECDNGLDDNLDGSFDCDDLQCLGAAACAEREATPELPEWLGEGDDSLSIHPLGRPCDEVPEAGPPISLGCTLAPDSCGAGLRCVVVTIDTNFSDTACVRQGCSPAFSPCYLGDFPDICPRETLCMDAPDLCGDLPCCVPTCASDETSCSSCLPLTRIFENGQSEHDDEVNEKFESTLENAGLCVDGAV